MKTKDKSTDKIWACLLHLSFNMWEEYVSPHRPFRGYHPEIRLSESLWDDALLKMAQSGLNMVVIDLGDAIKYKSHPEIAVRNAWTPERLKKELKKMRAMGLEPIPKLNFSAAHDTWLKDYSRMVSSEEYYSVCSDLIKEVCKIFSNPRFFHLGMDEESAENQQTYQFVMLRKNDAWWIDFYFLMHEVEKNGARPWIWPDYMLWNEPEVFFKRMPKSVLISNWYYSEAFDEDHFKLPGIDSEKNMRLRVNAYLELEKNGYDQIPTASFHDNNSESISGTVEFCKRNIDDARLLGFMQSFWKPTIEDYRELILKGIELMGDAKR